MTTKPDELLPSASDFMKKLAFTDAIHAAGWVSLFTLHALWPFLWIWAMAYRPERGWGFSSHSAATGAGPAAGASELEDLRRRIAELESKIGTGDR